MKDIRTYRVGDRVVVARSKGSYDTRGLLGMTGTITGWERSEIGKIALVDLGVENAWTHKGNHSVDDEGLQIPPLPRPTGRRIFVIDLDPAPPPDASKMYKARRHRPRTDI